MKEEIYLNPWQANALDALRTGGAPKIPMGNGAGRTFFAGYLSKYYPELEPQYRTARRNINNSNTNEGKEKS